MIGFLNDIFTKEHEPKFKLYGPFLSLAADVLLIYYIATSMVPRMLSKEKLLPMMAKINPDIRYLSQHELDSFVQIMQSSMSFTFLIILAFNTIMYLLASRQIKLGVKFLYGYCLSTCALSVLEMVGTLVTDYPFSWATFVTTFLYFYVWYGMDTYRKTDKQKEKRLKKKRAQ